MLELKPGKLFVTKNRLQFRVFNEKHGIARSYTVEKKVILLALSEPHKRLYRPHITEKTRSIWSCKFLVGVISLELPLLADANYAQRMAKYIEPLEKTP